VQDPEQAISLVEKEINNRVSPPLICSLDIHDVKGKKIIRILVPRGEEPPYALDDNKIYVRDEAETGLAVRDEIVGLVLRGAQISTTKSIVTTQTESENKSEEISSSQPSTYPGQEDISPRTGVEVIAPEDRQGSRYFTMRDLRNGNVVKNVTRTSARRLWHYAILRFTELSGKLDQANIQWEGDLGLIQRRKQGKTDLFDLIQRTSDGYRFYFGVTLDGIHGPWKAFIEEDET
jgi:hypothetical protein